MLQKYLALVILVAWIVYVPGVAADGNKFSFHVENKTVKAGKVFTSESDQYYHMGTRKLVNHFTQPLDIITIFSPQGEVKIYNPALNEVRVKQNHVFQTKGQNVYLFVENQTRDMGLNELGFIMIRSEIEEEYMVSYWEAPADEEKQTYKVKLVHENHVPVYTAYMNKKNELIKKTYYSDYENFNSFSFPRRITEIDYTPKGDSVISRTIFSNFRIGAAADSHFFNYKIPNNAKITGH